MIFPSLYLKIERWKFNKDFGIYVSTFGKFKDRYKRLLPIKVSDGYCYVQTETADFRLAHRVVMLTWRPIPDAENLTVDHLNHNKRDNSLSNLEWVTFEENQRRSKRDLIRFDNDSNIVVNEQGITYIIADKPQQDKENHKDKILGYSINGEGIYTKEEVFNKLIALRGKQSGTLTRKLLNNLESGKNTTGSKIFGNGKHRFTVTVIYKKEREND